MYAKGPFQKWEERRGKSKESCATAHNAHDAHDSHAHTHTHTHAQTIQTSCTQCTHTHTSQTLCTAWRGCKLCGSVRAPKSHGGPLAPLHRQPQTKQQKRSPPFEFAHSPMSERTPLMSMDPMPSTTSNTTQGWWAMFLLLWEVGMSKACGARGAHSHSSQGPQSCVSRKSVTKSEQ